jgi:hypothetical protein
MIRAFSAWIARCSRSVRQSAHITPTSWPFSPIGSQWSIGGESQGGAGQWQRRQAEAGSSLGRSTAGGDGSFAFAAGDNNTATAISDGCTIRVADVGGQSGSC